MRGSRLETPRFRKDVLERYRMFLLRAGRACLSADRVYTATYTVATSTPETQLDVDVTMPGTFADPQSNVVVSTAGTDLFTVDTVAPTVTLTSSAPPTTTSLASIPMTATFSEAVTGFVVGDVTVSNATADEFTAVSTTVYTFSVHPTVAGAVTVDVAVSKAIDARSNNNAAATQYTNEYVAGGGGGGGSAIYTPVPATPATPPTPATPTTPAAPASIAAQIQALLAQVVALQAKVAVQKAGAPAAFTRNLTLGSTGTDVETLQKFLVSKGHLAMPQGVAFGYFGGLTRAALVKYQAASGISPAVGYFGPLTRSAVGAEQ